MFSFSRVFRGFFGGLRELVALWDRNALFLTESRGVVLAAPSKESLVRWSRLLAELARPLGRDAPDVTHDVLIELMRQPGRGASTPSLRALLWSRWRSCQRSDRRRHDRERRSGYEGEVSSPPEILERDELCERVRREMAALPPHQREVLWLRFRDDLPLRVIADRLAIPLGTVESRLRRGLAELRRRLGVETSASGRVSALVVLGGLRGRVFEAIGASIMATGTKWALVGGVSLFTLGMIAFVDWSDKGGPSKNATQVAAGSAIEESVERVEIESPHRTPVDQAISTSPPSSDSSPGFATQQGRPVEVRESSGAPIAGASVASCDPQVRGGWFSGVPLPLIVRTNAKGRAFLNDLEVGRQIVVVAPGYAPSCQEFDPTLERQVIVLDDSVGLSGRVRVSGRAPDSPIHLSVKGVQTASGDWCSQARRMLSEYKFAEGGRRQETGEDGRFWFKGLPDRASVTLHFPDEYQTVGTKERFITVMTPDLDVLVHLEKTRAIVGRAIEREGEEGTGGHLTVVYKLFHQGECLHTGRTSTTAGVPFRILLEDRELDGADIALVRPNRSRFALREIRGDLSQGWNLGDISADPTFRFEYATFDGNGRPLQGAKAEVAGHVSQETGPDGNGGVEVPVTAKRFRAGAPGYQVVEGPLDPLSKERVKIFLQPSNELIVRVRDPQGRGAQGLQVRTSFGRPLEDDALEHFPEFAEVRGTRNSGAGWTESEHTLFYPTDEKGEVRISDFTVGESFVLAVRDRHQNALFEQRVSLGEGEKRLVEWNLTQEARSLKVKIVGPDGEPIAGATAYTGDMMWSMTMSGLDGSLEIGDIYFPTARVRVDAEGFVSREEDYELGEADVQHVIKLEKARVLWVETTTATGERVDVESVTVQPRDTPACGGVRRSVGFYEVQGVPRDEVEVVTVVDGKPMSLWAPADGEQFSVTVVR